MTKLTFKNDSNELIVHAYSWLTSNGSVFYRTSKWEDYKEIKRDYTLLSVEEE